MGQAIYRNRLPDINKTVAENAPALYKTLGALKEKGLLIEMVQSPSPPCYLIAADGTTKLLIRGLLYKYCVHSL